MKQNLHPQYNDMTVTCACGNSFVVGGTSKTLHVDVCSKCHPFFTGTQKFLDTLGRVDKFLAKRQAASGYAPKNKKSSKEDKEVKSLKEMLEVNKKKIAEEAKEEAKSE